MDKTKLFTAKASMFLLLGVLLVASDLTPFMWQYHAIALWGIALANIGRLENG